jgi:hypothetical protein
VTVKEVLTGDLSRGDALYYNRPGVVVVTWDATLQAVHIAAQGWADPTESRESLDAGLRALIEHHGSRWLVDGSNMKVVQQTDQDWINENWLPRALAAGLRRTAMVIPKSGLAMMNVDDMAGRGPDDQIDFRLFSTIEKAAEWLVGPRINTPISLEMQSIA